MFKLTLFPSHSPKLEIALKTSSLRTIVAMKISSHWKGQKSLSSPKASVSEHCHFLTCLVVSHKPPLKGLVFSPCEQPFPGIIYQKQSATIV